MRSPQSNPTRFTRRSLLLSAFGGLAEPVRAQELKLPNKPGSLKFGAIGDNGTGERPQYEVGAMMAEYKKKFDFGFFIMLGDNIYGSESAGAFDRKFTQPYKALLDTGVKFYASLGNHDEPTQRFFKPFNMDGKRYYSFKPGERTRFFALDTTYMDKEQLAWIDKELSGGGNDWKICYFHHPLYSSGGRHGSSVEMRTVLEPLFLKHGVNVVFSGHEHFYERLHPQNGIHYFISGAGGKLRKSNIKKGSALTAAGFDLDQHFMLLEIDGNELHFQAISRTGKTVDSGTIRREDRK